MERREQSGFVSIFSALILALGVSTQAQYGDGTGTADDPFLIYTPEQMNAIGADPNDWDKHFKLMADIDLAQFDGKEGRPAFNLIAPDTDPNERRFQGTPFTGVFDGNGHTIANFTWSGSDREYVGLFRYVSGADAEIKNVGLIDPNICANAGSEVGALVGQLLVGTVRDCFVEGGTVLGCGKVGGLVGEVHFGGEVAYCHAAVNVCGEQDVGGLVGSNCARVTDCDATGRVVGERYVGGLIGSNWTYWSRFFVSVGTVSNCRATGSVSGSHGIGGLVGFLYDASITDSDASAVVSGDNCAGGLVGRGSGDITSCYADGPVTAETCGGGLVGDNWEVITNCYALGSVVGGRQIGGLVGDNEGTIRNCYAGAIVSGESEVGGLVGSAGPYCGAVLGSCWDIEASGQVASAQGIGRTTAQMWRADTYFSWASWGSEGIWTIDEGNDYPRLWWEGRPGQPLVVTNLSDMLAGSGIEEDPYLIYTAEELNTIGLFPCTWNQQFRLMADIDLSAYFGAQFNPIGDRLTPFTGVFDGNGCTISHFTYRSPRSDGTGLFGCVDDPNAIVTRLAMVNPNVSAGSKGYAGVLVGRLLAGTVSQCSVRGGCISGNGNVGGLVGRSQGTIINCVATGDVAGRDAVGGIVGNSIGVVTECRSTCNVSGVNNVGILVGSNGREQGREKGLVTSSCADGTAIGEACVGGLAGFSLGTITDCYAQGTVSGIESVGGLIGYRQWGTVSNCYAAAVVTGERFTGGLVGCNSGGTMGVPACFWDVEATGSVNNGAGTAMTTTEMQTAERFLEAGWDFVGEVENGTKEIWWILEGQDYPRLWWERADAEF